jgi:hypothetical protein
MQDKKSGEGMSDAATARMASAVSAPAPARVQNEPIDVRLVDEAATTLHDLSGRTGLTVDALLAASITLLKIVIESRNLGRRIVLTTKLLWPIREVHIP